MSSSQILIFSFVSEYLAGLAASEQAKIDMGILAIAQDILQVVRTKQLRGPIREFIIGNHRLVYFQKDDCLYVVSAFYKKTTKTPKKEIEYAEKIYKNI
jgi:phage-related protein